jgi:hypothetical protein
MEEAPTLQQYSKQLNVYDSTDTHRGRLFINAADLLEISYKAGLSAVVVQNLCYQDGNLDTPHNVSSEFYMVNGRVDTERVRAIAAEGVSTAAVESERTRAQAEEKKSSDGLASEVASRTSAVSSVASSIATEVAARISDVVSLQQLMANESTARSSADAVHTSSIALASFNLGLEAKRADDEEKRILGLITTETAARASADSIIVSSNTAFNTRAVNAEAGLQAAITAETAARDLAVEFAKASVSADLAVESARALASELALSDRIDAVLSNIDVAALDSFTEVVTALQGSGAGGLAGAINTADSRALAAEASLQGQISALLAAVLALQAPY